MYENRAQKWPILQLSKKIKIIVEERIVERHTCFVNLRPRRSVWSSFKDHKKGFYLLYLFLHLLYLVCKFLSINILDKCFKFLYLPLVAVFYKFPLNNPNFSELWFDNSIDLEEIEWKILHFVESNYKREN